MPKNCPFGAILRRGLFDPPPQSEMATALSLIRPGPKRKATIKTHKKERRGNKKKSHK